MLIMLTQQALDLFDNSQEIGPYFGYHVIKCHLIVWSKDIDETKK